MPRPVRANENPGTHVKASTGGSHAVTAAGHSGHTLTVYADKAVYCETHGAFVASDDILNKNLL
jgi:hypothetical protein